MTKIPSELIRRKIENVKVLCHTCNGFGHITECLKVEDRGKGYNDYYKYRGERIEVVCPECQGRKFIEMEKYEGDD